MECRCADVMQSRVSRHSADSRHNAQRSGYRPRRTAADLPDTCRSTWLLAQQTQTSAISRYTSLYLLSRRNVSYPDRLSTACRRSQLSGYVRSAFCSSLISDEQNANLCFDTTNAWI